MANTQRIKNREMLWQAAIWTWETLLRKERPWTLEALFNSSLNSGRNSESHLSLKISLL